MKVIHCCIDIRGVLRWGDAGLRGMFMKDGRKMKGAEVREYLLDQLEAGRKMLPMGEPCEGFSFATGCPGHIHHEAAEQVA